MRSTVLTALLVLGSLLAAESVRAAPPPVPPGLEFRQSGYFELRKDVRRCAAPLCGGYWLTRVNQVLTVCADGKPRSRCYVPELEGAPDDLIDGLAPVLVRGSISPREYSDPAGTLRNLGIFRFLAGWRPAGPGAVSIPEARKPHYSGVENSGIVCISTPCQSYTEFVLNTPRQRLLADIDTSLAGAPPELEQKLIDAIAAGETVMMRGLTRQSDETMELVFEAWQLFLPVR